MQYLPQLLYFPPAVQSRRKMLQRDSDKVGDMKGYKAKAEMTLTVGSEPQSYNLDVWHNKPT